MNFEASRLSSAWGHIAFCANPTWAPEPPDDYTLRNQRLLTQHYRVAQLLQDSEAQNLQSSKQCELQDSKRAIASQSQDSVCIDNRRSVKEVIPESRLARFYGEFFYDDEREKCYTSPTERSNLWSNGQVCENELTECWMLPEVEYWFQKMVEDPSDRSQSRRQELMLPDEDQSADDAEVAALDARLRSTRYLWEPARARPPSPPNVSRKMRARRQQPRRTTVPQPPPAYCLDIPTQMLCHPTCKQFQFNSPRHPQIAECHRGLGRLTTRGHAMNTSASRCQTFRGASVSRYTPTQRTGRSNVTSAGLLAPSRLASHLLSTTTTARLRSTNIAGQMPSTSTACQLLSASASSPLKYTKVAEQAPINITADRAARTPTADQASSNSEAGKGSTTILEGKPPPTSEVDQLPSTSTVSPLTSNSTGQMPSADGASSLTTSSTQDQAPSSSAEALASEVGQLPSTSAAGSLPAMHAGAINAELRNKRLYSTVLSMSAPAPIGLTPVVRLAQKLVAPGLIKLNSKLALSGARVRTPQVEHKFEELEKEALEQYKASDESIDTKFRELEKEAVEQYSNSNTSCSSGNSAEKQASSLSSATDTKSCSSINAEDKHGSNSNCASGTKSYSSSNSSQKRNTASPSENETKNKHSEKTHKEKTVESVVIYSQNFPDLNSKGQTSSAMNLKNFHTPPRGEKKEHTHRPSKNLRSLKSDSQRAASDTDYEVRENSSKGNYKGGARWSLPKKQRHLTLCVSDCSSDEEVEEGVLIKDARPRIKARANKLKMSAHGGGDLHPIMRKK